MKSIKDTQYLISETSREVRSLTNSIIEAQKLTVSNIDAVRVKAAKDVKAFKREVQKKMDRISFLRDIISYLETEPREGYLRDQEEKLSYRIAKVDEKIADYKALAKNPLTLSNQIKHVKAEFDYAKQVRQLEVILFILN